MQVTKSRLNKKLLESETIVRVKEKRYVFAVSEQEGVFTVEDPQDGSKQFKTLSSVKQFIRDRAEEIEDAEGVTHVVSFSGGRTSAFLVYLLERRREKEGIKTAYVFSDTGGEHPKTYEFIRNVVKHFGIKLTVLRARVSQEMDVGVTYEEISLDEMGWDLKTIRELCQKYGNFTIGRPGCTNRLKTVIANKYIDDNYGKKSVRWLGMRVDEKKRVKFEKDEFENNPHRLQYLANVSDYTKEDVLRFWRAMPFDLELPEHLGNCVFCIKKSDVKLALAARDEPEKMVEWREAVEGDHVREMPTDLYGVGKIYRGWNSLDTLIASFSDTSTKKLREIVYKTSKLSEGCESSCEAFGDPNEYVPENEGGM